MQAKYYQLINEIGELQLELAKKREELKKMEVALKAINPPEYNILAPDKALLGFDLI